jgi:hypothetical protein
VRKRISLVQRRAKQSHDAFVSPAVTRDDEAKPGGGVRQAFRKRCVLACQIIGEILQVVVSEIPVQLQ